MLAVQMHFHNRSLARLLTVDATLGQTLTLAAVVAAENQSCRPSVLAAVETDEVVVTDAVAAAAAETSVAAVAAHYRRSLLETLHSEDTRPS